MEYTTLGQATEKLKGRFRLACKCALFNPQHTVSEALETRTAIARIINRFRI